MPELDGENWTAEALLAAWRSRMDMRGYLPIPGTTDTSKKVMDDAGIPLLTGPHGTNRGIAGDGLYFGLWAPDWAAALYRCWCRRPSSKAYPKASMQALLVQLREDTATTQREVATVYRLNGEDGLLRHLASRWPGLVRNA